MTKQFLNSLTGEFLEISKIQPVTIVSAEVKRNFRTNYTDNSKTYDAEVNSGDYIVDDSQYIDFKKLLQRSAQCSKEAIDFLSEIPVVDNVGGIDDIEIDKVLKEMETDVSVVNSAELSTGTPETQTEVAGDNPVDNSPDVSGEPETNG